MKFVHIADMHFDSPFITLSDKGNLGEQRRIEQRKIYKKVIEYIKENKEPIKVAETINNAQSIDDLFNDVPISSNESNTKVQAEDDTYDLQKELEAKFDELFGPLDDDD